MYRQPVLVAAVCIMAAMVSSCGLALDAADREYMTALRGENQAMTRAEQIAHVDRAIAKAPTRPNYWETRAIYKIDLHDFRGAISDLNRVIALDSRPYPRFLRGLALCQSGQPARALPDFDAAISSQPENAQFYRGRALARAALGQSSMALEDAEQLLRLAPQMAESYYTRGIALKGLGRANDAVQDFTESLRQRPELVYPLRARADAYEQTGATEQAVQDRIAAARKEQRARFCPPCTDPFRY